MEGPTVSGAGLGAPSLALGVQRVTGSDGGQEFHRCCGGRIFFVSVQKKNMLHTNPNCKIVQDSTKSTYAIMVL